MPSGIVVGDLLYLINDMQSILTVYEAATGTLVYQDRLGVGDARRLLGVAGRTSTARSSSRTTMGRRSSWRPGRTFKLLHVNELGAQTLASPALVDGTWYWRTAEALVAIR